MFRLCSFQVNRPQFRPPSPGGHLRDRVVGVGCTVTGDYLRPVYADGPLTLHVTPAAAGSVVPLEVEGNHAC